MSDLLNEPHLTLPFLREVAGSAWEGCTHDAVFASGVDYALGYITPNSLLVIVDPLFWSINRIKHSGQREKNDADIYHLAKAKGAVGFISSKDFNGRDLPVIRVENSSRFLLDVARANRIRYSGKVVAVTGTTGKSSTVAIIIHLLKSLGFSVLGTVGNHNTIYGASAALTRLDSNFDVAVLETAISGFVRFKEHVGKLVRPNIAVITQIDKGQMDLVAGHRALEIAGQAVVFEGTEEETARFKGMLIESLEPGGVAIYNADTKQTDYLESVSKQYATKVIRYGEAAERYRLESFSVNSPEEGEVTACVNGNKVRYTIPVPSKAMASNTIAALAVMNSLGYLNDDVYEHLKSIPKRKRLLEISDIAIGNCRIRVIDDTRNAEIPSVKEALEVLGSLSKGKGRRIIVIGYIVNLGEHSDLVHRELAESVLAAKPDLVFGYGEPIKALMERIPEALRGGISSSPKEMARLVLSAVKDGDTVLIKGSIRDTRFREVPKLIITGSRRRADGSQRAARKIDRSIPAQIAQPSTKDCHRELAHVRIFIHGKVQKVGFRKWLIDLAQTNGTDGWVRNRSDGSLEAVLKGDRNQVGQVILQCHEGPRQADVSQIVVQRRSGRLSPGFCRRRTVEVGTKSKSVVQISPRRLFGRLREFLRRRASGVSTPPIARRRRSKRTYTLTLCGDTSLGDSYLSRLGDESGLFWRLCHAPLSFFEHVRPLIANSDRLIVGLETCLVSGRASPFEGKKQYLDWNDPERTLGVLKEIGVDAVNLANNHTMDFGSDCLLETIAKLRNAGISTFGAGENRRAASRSFTRRLKVMGHEKALFVIGTYEIKRRYKERYDYYATTSSAGISALSRRRVTGRIERLRAENPDALVIACPHWYRNYKWAGDKEAELSSALIAAGADLVIGSGSHMLGPCHWSEAGTQVLSIGNFVFNSPGRYDQFSAPPFSLIARLDLKPEAEGWSSALKLYPILTDNRRTGFQVRPVDRAMLASVYSLLAERAPDASAFRSHFEPGQDERGLHIRLTRPISPRFVCACSAEPAATSAA